jgi:hypothetical protein
MTTLEDMRRVCADQASEIRALQLANSQLLSALMLVEHGDSEQLREIASRAINRHRRHIISDERRS